MATNSNKSHTKLTIYPVTPLFQPLVNWKKVFGRSLMALGAFIIVATIFLTQMAYITPDKQTIVLSKETSDDIYPVSLELKQLSAHYDLEKDTIKYGLWPLSDSHPVYLETSGTPEKPGNIVIYGHNTSKIFGNLSSVKEGSEVTIITNNNQSLTYKIDSIKKVFPQDVQILEQGREERITLFTCTGLFDSMRLVVSGKRI
jgi:LPXTG-site transpeptidase (sortase) family protein